MVRTIGELSIRIIEVNGTNTFAADMRLNKMKLSDIALLAAVLEKVRGDLIKNMPVDIEIERQLKGDD